MPYKYRGKTYELNLIDTPGHVDFHYEVSRSLSCCEGALLLADAFQGVEAQTVANAYAAMEHDLAIIPVINKVDLTHARTDEVKLEMEHTLALTRRKWCRSAPKRDWAWMNCWSKSCSGFRHLKVTRRAAAGHGLRFALRRLSRAHHLRPRAERSHRQRPESSFAARRTNHDVVELGHFQPQRTPARTLGPGQVGYVICNIKSLDEVHIGDTLSVPAKAAAEPLPGYQEPKRMVYCGLYPSDGQNFEELREALSKLAINDPSFEFEPESSDALGFGFRCGFSGPVTHGNRAATTGTRIRCRSGADGSECDLRNPDAHMAKTLEIHKPQDVPDAGQIAEFRQPIVRVNMVQPTEYIGAVMKLCQERRGVQVRTEYSVTDPSHADLRSAAG